MFSPEELTLLESLLIRARAYAGIDRAEEFAVINVGDLVQLRPGADSHWETSFLQVGMLRDDGRISGAILRPHRSGCREAWYSYTPPEIIRVGRSPFPPPRRAIRDQSYLAWCPACMRRS